MTKQKLQIYIKFAIRVKTRVFQSDGKICDLHSSSDLYTTYLIFIEIIWQTPDKDLVRCIGNHGRNHAYKKTKANL